MRFLYVSLIAIALFCGIQTKSAPRRVACVGNSITYGYGLADSVRSQLSYPGQLQQMLGPDWEVRNFGHNGATLLNSGHNPYTKLPEFKQALEFRPDIVVIHLGINDTDSRDWPNFSDNFHSDYVALIDSFKAVNPQVRVMMARLTPIKASHPRFRSGTQLWRMKIQDAIENIAQITGAELIDFDTPLRNRQNLIFDHLHPNATGYQILAQTVRRAIDGDYGGLRLPIIYQDSMILQRNRPLKISGIANAHEPVTIKLGQNTANTTADNLGRWSVTMPPISSNKTYTLEAKAPSRTLRIKNILAGEVWLASGQSNMAFQLAHERFGTDTLPTETDSQLRFYTMFPTANTNARQWTDAEITATDTLGYFKPAVWQAIGRDNAGSHSAVAIHFARVLRDSLQCPVGIICNAVGGAPAESYIDTYTLEEYAPEVLINWQTNDYVQPWAQQRAKQNAGSHRHPYEPSYLYATGIKPIEGYPIAGVIWYQGESNAHNTDVHEMLFPLVVKTHRKSFECDTLPFHTVQLSSINRPSWPSFRDSQRRLALNIPGVTLTVSSDLGDSLDVHPIDKLPIGQRLARQALHHNYEYKALVPEGPVVKSVTADGNKITIVLDNAKGLTTSDGNDPRTFEVAELDGLFIPQKAQIDDNKIIITANSVKTPQFVRYAWQPFTRANVVNGDDLPMSTFKIAIDNENDSPQHTPNN